MSTYKERYEERKKNKSGDTYQSRYLKRKVERGELDIDAVGKDLSNRVNTWLDNNQKYFTEANTRFSGDNSSYRADASDWLNSATSRNQTFQTEADNIKKDLDYYAPLLGQDYVDSVLKALDGNIEAQKSILTAANSDLEYWSRWENEGAWKRDYEASLAQAEQNKADLAYDLGAGSAKIEQYQKDFANINSGIERTQNTLAQLRVERATLTGRMDAKSKNRMSEIDRQIAACEKAISDAISQQGGIKQAIEDEKKKYSSAERAQKSESYKSLTKESDFAANSQPISKYIGGEIYNNFAGAYTNLGYADYDDVTHGYINGEPLARSIMDSTYGAQAKLYGYDKSQLLEMTPEEVSIYNYVYNTEGKESAKKYLDFIMSDLNARKRAEESEYWAKEADESPFLMSIFSIATSPLKTVSFVGQTADYIEDGAIDQNASYNKFSHINTTIRNEVSDKIEKNWGGVGSFAYQTGMSMADFLLNTAITGGNSAFSLGIMGSSAAADTVISAKDRGLSDSQAYSLGIIAGAAEIITEKVSIEALLDKTTLGKNALEYVLKNVLSEGGEEVSSSVINLIADVLISKDKSEWQALINEYKRQDMDDQKAFWHAVGDQALSLGLDFLGGAISGGVMGGGSVGINKAVNKFEQNRFTKSLGQDILDYGNKDVLMEMAKQVADDRAVTRAAKKVEKKANAKNVGNLSQKLLKNIAKSTAELETALVNEGLTKDEARLVAKYSMGEDLSEAEEKKVESNEKYIDAVNKVFAKKNKTLTTEANSEIIESEATANENNAEAESIRVRDGGERLGSENTERPILQMERGSGAYSQWRKALGTKPRDSQAARIVNKGREVTVASLGVAKGSNIHKVRLVDAENETDSMKKARKQAESRGLTVKFFVGGNLVIEEKTDDNIGKADEDKTYFEANGYINGNVMLVRADHYKFTADQIARHESGHDMIAKGEVDIKSVRKRLIEIVGGEENIDDISKLYAEAYKGTTLDGDEIFEELICDSLGDMNIFAYGEEAAELMALAIPDVQRAVNEAKGEPNQRRGSPEGEGKASVDYGRQDVDFDALKKSRKDNRTHGKASRELDSAYLSAVERGDMNTAQRMVYEAAKAAGYKEHLYHGTNADFTKFDLRKHGGRNGKGEGYGIYLAANREISAPYGKNVIDSYVKFNRLAEGRKKTLSYNEVKSLVKRSCEIEAQRMVDDEEYDSVSEALRDTWVSNIVYTYDYSNISQVYADVANKLWKENDNDGDLINEMMALSGAHYDYNNALDFYDNILTPITGIDGFHYIWGNKDGSGEQNDIYLAFRSEQIKSADPVTYDDNRNVIPLSERFNEKNEDIRFSRELDVITHMDAVAIAEGREMYEGKAPTDRERLANALESITENDIERKKLKEYKANIEKMNAETEKLKKLKAEIKELTFGKGKKDPQKLKELRAEATKTENRINTYDKMLLNLEASSVLKGVLMREKQKAYKRAAEKGREALHKNVVGRNKTAMRHKIQDVAHRLDKLLNHATKERNVKKGQSALVRRALDLTDLLFASDDDLLMNGIETIVSDKELDAMNKYIELYNKYHSYDDAVSENKEIRKEIRSEMNEVKKAFEGVLERERKRISKAKSTDVFNALISEYEKIAQSEDEYIAHAFDKETREYLEGLRDAVGDTLVKDMTLDQLEMVYKAFRMIETMVSKSNKMFNESLKATAEELGTKTLNEVLAHKRKTEFTQLGKAYSELSWNNLKPIYLMERIGSKTLQMLFDNILEGESTFAKYAEEAQVYMDEQKSKYNFKNWDFKKKWKFTTKTGLEFELGLGQIFTIYAYAQRGEQALNHLRVDGFVFDNLKVIKKNKLGIPIEYELNDKTAYKLDDDNLMKIVGNPLTGEKGILTDEQINYVVAMQKYLSETLGKRGNEVSEQMYGIDLFNEENYLPILSEGAYMERVREQAQGTPKIKNRAHTKPTVKGARNAIVLTNFNEIWSEHVTSMNEYVAFTLPLEDFYKVYNYTNKSSEESDKRGVIPAIENAYGKAASKAIDQLLTDLNGGTRTDSREGIAKTLMGAFKKAKVMLSLSVIVQQPSSILRAQAVIDPKYFVGEKLSKQKHKEAWEELKKYAPVAIIKEMGYFDVGMGKSTADWIMNEPDWKDRLDEITSKGAAYADEVTWIAIWNAVKRETLHTHKDLKPNSKEFLEAAGKRFEKVIRLTQVYDSTLSRSAYMRSKSAIVQMLTAFMAEPTTSLNMREMALRSGNKNRIIRTTAAVYASALLNAILVAFPYAMRDDDEDETFVEKYISALTTNFVGNINPLASIPYIKDIWSIAQGYSVERADMTLVDDFISSMKSVITESAKEETDPKALTNAIINLVGDFANMTGIPVKNLVREIKATINFGKTVYRGDPTTWNSLTDALEKSLQSEIPVWGWLPKETKKEKIVEAIQKGDKTYVERFKSSYEDEKSFYSAVKSEVGDLYRSGKMTSREAEKILKKYGGFDKEEADDDIYWLIKEWDYKKKHGKDAEYSKYTEWYEAVKTGRNIKSVIKEYTEHGVDEETLASQITKYYKPLYIKMSKSERASIKGYLLNAYALLGYNRSEKSRDIDAWLKG